MNVGGSFGGNYGGYRGGGSSQYGGGRSAGQRDQMHAPRPAMPYGDLLNVASLGRREPLADRSSPEQTIDRFKKGRNACWVLGAISLFAFSIMAAQPVLLPLCTFGMCFSNGWSDWLEFTTSILKMSLFPASLGALFVGVGFFCDQSLKEIEAQAATQDKTKLTPDLRELVLRQGRSK